MLYVCGVCDCLWPCGLWVCARSVCVCVSVSVSVSVCVCVCDCAVCVCGGDFFNPYPGSWILECAPSSLSRYSTFLA